MIETVSSIAMVLLSLSALAALYRVVVGPTIADRVISLDTASVHVIALIIVFSIRTGTQDYIDAALALAILSFISTVAVAKFMVKGVIIDRNRR